MLATSHWRPLRSRGKSITSLDALFRLSDASNCVSFLLPSKEIQREDFRDLAAISLGIKTHASIMYLAGLSGR